MVRWITFLTIDLTRRARRNHARIFPTSEGLDRRGSVVDPEVMALEESARTKSRSSNIPRHSIQRRQVAQPKPVPSKPLMDYPANDAVDHDDEEVPVA